MVATDGLRSADDRGITGYQRLIGELGGTFHSVVGEDVPQAVVDFATAVNATMIIVGTSRHGRVRRLFSGSTGPEIADRAGSIDVHLVTHPSTPGPVRLRLRPLTTTLSPRPPRRGLDAGPARPGAAHVGAARCGHR
ncbi:MAG: universal stress protein [Nocardioidaceae bacterium]